MSSNYERNKAEIDKFRKELRAMMADISGIDVTVLNRSINAGMRYAKNNSPVITGYFRKRWSASPAVKKKNGEVKKVLVNSADYASYVNYGHRTVNGKGETTGYVRSKVGDHLLERAVSYSEKMMIREFNKAVKEVQTRHDK